MNAALERLSEARQLSADLLVHFTKAADAANRAVMADTDAASVSFAQEADQAKQAAHHDVDLLKPILERANYPDETRLLQEFVDRFAQYEVLDRSILDLAVENTNLKAQRLSFGPAQDAADAFRDSLEAAKSGVSAQETWRVQALIARAVLNVREIQVLEAPHVAEADDAVMTRMETRMAASESDARKALVDLGAIVAPASKAPLAKAGAALDRFMSVNAAIVALSRRNTNVRSLALALTQKPALTSACEDRVRALQAALAKRSPSVARWK